MRTILTRYVVRAVVAGALLVLAVLVGLDAMFALVGELESMGEGDYGLYPALTYIALTLPDRVYTLFPAAVAIGGVLGLGTLAANAELTVMRAAGISIGRIVGMVMQGGVLLLLFIVFVGEVVAPPAQHRAERLRATAIAGQGNVHAERGLWVRDGQRFISVGEILPGYVLRDVEVYEFSDRRLARALRAERARFVDGRWQVHEIRSTRLQGDTLTTERVEQSTWDRLVRPELFELLAVQPSSLPIWRLDGYVEYLERNRLDAARFQLAFWQKIATPLSTLVMLLLSLPVIFGPLRSAGVGQRIFLGSLIGVGYFLASELFAHIGIVYGLAAPVAALAPVILFSAVGVHALRRIV